MTSIEPDRIDELVAAAREIRAAAYAPYSGFHVGAALLAGGIFTAVNMENASYPMSVCAERNAVAMAVAAGETSLRAVAVVTDAETEPTPPCGGCRQVLWEFGEGMAVIAESASGTERRYWALATSCRTPSARTTPGELLRGHPVRHRGSRRPQRREVDARERARRTQGVDRLGQAADDASGTARGPHDGGAQAVFTDTPGSTSPEPSSARLNDVVGDAVEGVDVILHVLDAASGVGRGDAFVYERRVRPHGCPKIAVVNKIDVTGQHGVVPQLAAAAEIGERRDRPCLRQGREGCRHAPGHGPRDAPGRSGALSGGDDLGSAARDPARGDGPREGAPRDPPGAPALDHRYDRGARSRTRS